jgi:hypothetical protein
VADVTNGADLHEAVRVLATALDELGARFHRDLHPESSYLDTDDPTAVRLAIDDFAAYVEVRMNVLDHPAVKRALTEVK